MKHLARYVVLLLIVLLNTISTDAHAKTHAQNEVSTPCLISSYNPHKRVAHILFHLYNASPKELTADCSTIKHPISSQVRDLIQLKNRGFFAHYSTPITVKHPFLSGIDACDYYVFGLRKILV